MTDIGKALEGLEVTGKKLAPDRTGACGEPGCTSCPESKPHPFWAHLQTVKQWVGAARLVSADLLESQAREIATLTAALEEAREANRRATEKLFDGLLGPALADVHYSNAIMDAHINHNATLTPTPKPEWEAIMMVEIKRQQRNLKLKTVGMDPDPPCEVCGGSGEAICAYCDGECTVPRHPDGKEETCKDCEGNGKEPCPDCNPKGKPCEMCGGQLEKPIMVGGVDLVCPRCESQKEPAIPCNPKGKEGS